MTPTGMLPLVLTAALLGGQGPAYATEEGPPRRFEAELTLTLHVPKLKAREWLLVAAQLPNLAGQRAEAASLRPGGRAGHELSAARRPVLTARIPATNAELRQGVAAKVKYEVVLR